MIKSLSLLSVLLVFSNNSVADSISSFSEPETFIRIHQLSESSSQLETCLNGECTLVPDTESLNLNGFSFEGNEEDWENFFNHCSSYEGLNRFYRVTKTVSLILLAWHPAGQVGQSAFVSQASQFVARRSFNLVGRSVPLFVKYSLRFWAPSQISENTNQTMPYPEVNANSAITTEFATRLIYDGEESYTNPTTIADYIEVLRSCSSVYLDRKIEEAVREQFNYYFSIRYQPNCSSCHEQEEYETPAYENRSYDISLLPFQTQDSELLNDDLLKYLESLEDLN